MDTQEPTYKVEKYRWLKQRVRLDLLYIDEDIQELPVLLQDAGEITAAAMERREATKSDLERTAAIVADKLRSPENGKSKSETAIASMIPLDPEYQAVQKELSEARLDAALWQNLMEALRSKSALVRASADLIQASFISTSYYVDKRKKDMRAKT
jgi:hypothetical protein